MKKRKLSLKKKRTVKRKTMKKTIARGLQVPGHVPHLPSAITLESPAGEERKPEFAKELPGNYGDNDIYLMVRDPYWIYAYWEIQEGHEEAVLQKLGGNRNEIRSILRVYDTSDKNSSSFFDIDLAGLARNWYIETQPNRSYTVEIGLLHKDGRFLALARSNEVTTPRAGMSEIIDEHWMGIDFEKMYALSGGFEAGKSSQELRKLMEERLARSISSGSGAGASPVRK